MMILRENWNIESCFKYGIRAGGSFHMTKNPETANIQSFSILNIVNNGNISEHSPNEHTGNVWNELNENPFS